MIRAARCIAAPLIGAALLVSSPATAQTQPEPTVESIDPVWMAVRDEVTPMRSGDLDRFYAVAEFKRGALVHVDGRGTEWARVRYPAAGYALVRAGEAEQIDDTTIRLTAPSRLRAPSLLYGLRGSWKSLYTKPLDAGTTLKVVGTEADSSGQVVGYRVRPPAPPIAAEFANGFVRLGALRPATDGEIAAHRAALAANLKQASPAGAPVQARAEPPVADAVDQPEPEVIAQRPAVDTSLLDPPAAEAASGEAASGDEASPIEIASAEGGLPAVPAPVVRPPVLPEAAAWDDLESAFERARALPREELDEALDELLAEYTRALDPDGEPIIVEAMEQRIAWIELRIATRDHRRELATALAEADEIIAAQRARIAQWEAGRGFAMVGRLVRSGVYDGQRLPLMYRVQSSSPAGPRTIGYIRPDGGVDLSPKLGRVVGIRGHREIDPALGLAIIRPTVVEVME